MNQLNNKSGWKGLAEYSKPYKVPIIIVLVLAIVGAVFSLIGPKQLESITNIIVDGIGGTINLAAVKKIGVTLLTIYLIGFVVNYMKRFLMAGVTQRLNDDLRNKISVKINKLPLAYFDKVSYGDVLSRVTNDVDTIGRTLNQSLPTIITSVTLLIGSLIMMATTNVTMALSAVLVSLIGTFIVSRLADKSQPYYNQQQKEIGNLNGYIEEAYSGHNVIKAYNATDQTKAEFSVINDKLYNNGWKANFLSGIMSPLMSFIGNLSYVVVCVLGAAMVLKGRIEFGVIVAFTVYIRQFNNPLSQMTQIVGEVQTALAASQRINEFLGEEEMEDETYKPSLLENVKGEVEFENVKFGYNPDKMIVNDFSSSAEPGQKIAIVGPTGAGKTTMINLLMRFYELNSGSIKIDGIPTHEVTRANVRDQFSMVLQDTWIFEGTVLENIVYSEENVPFDDVVNACKKVGLDHFIRTLPNGYHTVLDDSTSLSEGQKQQLTIARAMIKNAPLLILDEATSSVDTRTELIIQAAMDDLMEGRTSFVIAHRLSTIRNSDLILVMKDGDIIESGTHDQLMEDGGFYHELYNSQFEKVA